MNKWIHYKWNKANEEKWFLHSLETSYICSLIIITD